MRQKRRKLGITIITVLVFLSLAAGTISTVVEKNAHAETGQKIQTETNTTPETNIIEAYSSQEFEVEVSEDGLYELTVEYAQPKDNTRDILIHVKVDGTLPFAEAKSITLPRIYENEGAIRTDANGNEIAPRQVMVLTPVKHTLMSTSGFYNGNY